VSAVLSRPPTYAKNPPLVCNTDLGWLPGEAPSHKMLHMPTQSKTSKPPKTLTRCPWPPLDDPLYVAYHDKEWGVPLHDDRKLFEFLVLEVFQAGLSWRCVLHDARYQAAGGRCRHYS
jgi:hypothetical protein